MSATILLVDGDFRFRALVAAVLRAQGFEVLEAGSGKEATSTIGVDVPDLVIVDGALPDTDGLGWISLLRSRGSDVAVIFVSASSRDPLSHRHLIEELKVASVVTKPIAPAHFAELVEMVLGSAGMDRRSQVEVGEGVAPDFEKELKRLRRAFREELPSRLRELGDALVAARKDPAASEKLGAAREIAHRLRGTAGSYGFLQVGEEAGRIEDRIVQGLEEGRMDEGAWRETMQALEQAERGIGANPHSIQQSPYNALARVLVVDDDLNFLNLVREMGRASLVDVIGAPTATEALEVAQSSRVDAVIIDAHLAAGEDAFALGRALRTFPGKSTLPFAIASVDLGVENRVAAAHSGASIFLPKPLSGQRFEAAVRHMLAERQRSLPRILVVDDDPDFARQVVAVLGEERMVVTSIVDVANLLEALAKEPPDLLLLDMEMPGMSGVDACRLVRMTPDWQDIPILFLTAHTGVDARIAAFEAGADDYLSKPVVPQEIRTRVRLRLERNRLLRERSDRDALTGLLNRRALFEVFPARCAEARRHDRPISVGLLDLDYFKEVNDAHGHLVGDQVLMRLGRLLSARFRTEDLRGRWGGEEFLVVFPGETPGTIRGVLERVLVEFAEMPFYDERGEVFHCSFSVGIAGAPEDGSSPESLIQAADRRLYIAKRGGRARVESEG